jgi:hypothetical protein
MYSENVRTVVDERHNDNRCCTLIVHDTKRGDTDVKIKRGYNIYNENEID